MQFMHGNIAASAERNGQQRPPKPAAAMLRYRLRYSA
jgi:hypothetical protein